MFYFFSLLNSDAKLFKYLFINYIFFFRVMTVSSLSGELNLAHSHNITFHFSLRVEMISCLLFSRSLF